MSALATAEPLDRWSFLAVAAEDMERIERRIIDRVLAGDRELAELQCKLIGARQEAQRLAIRARGFLE